MPQPYQQVDYFKNDVPSTLNNMVYQVRLVQLNPPEAIVVPVMSLRGSSNSESSLYRYPDKTVNHGGAYGKSFYDVFYNRLHFSPVSLNFGNILDNKTESIEIVNMFFHPVNVENVTVPVDDNISVTQPDVTPFQIQSFNSTIYQVHVSSSGSPSFEDRILWEIEGKIHSVLLFGKRVTLFPFKPNWSSPVVERLLWKTDVIKSYNKDEQRIQVRSQPRQELEYSISLVDRDLRKFRALLTGWQNRSFAVPLWQNQGVLVDDIAPGQVIIELNTLYKNFTDNSIGVIYRSHDENEIIEIESITNDSLILSKPLSGNWSKHDKVYPLRVGIMPFSTPFSAPISNVVLAGVSWKFLPGENNHCVPNIEPEKTFLAHEFLDLKHNWLDGLPITHDYESRMFDPGVGTWSHTASVDFPDIETTYKLSLFDKASLEEIKGLLGRMSGRLKPLFIPTMIQDFKVVSDITVTATSFTVENQGFEVYRNENVDKAVFLKFRDGSSHLSMITGVNSFNDSEEIVSIADPFLENQSVDQVITAQLVRLMRSVVDGFTINHLSDTVSLVDLNMVSVKQ